MTHKVNEQIELLAATLGITLEEAAEMLQESVQENQLSFGSEFVVCEDPMTGTLEIMYLKGQDE